MPCIFLHFPKRGDTPDKLWSFSLTLSNCWRNLIQTLNGFLVFFFGYHFLTPCLSLVPQKCIDLLRTLCTLNKSAAMHFTMYGSLKAPYSTDRQTLTSLLDFSIMWIYWNFPFLLYAMHSFHSNNKGSLQKRSTAAFFFLLIRPNQSTVNIDQNGFEEWSARVILRSHQRHQFLTSVMTGLNCRSDQLRANFYPRISTLLRECSAPLRKRNSQEEERNVIRDMRGRECCLSHKIICKI